MAEKIQIVINAKDNASGPIGKVNRSLTGLQSAAGVVGKAIAGGLAVGGAAFAAFGAASLNISIDVEDAFAGVIKTTDGLIDVSGDLTDAGRSLRRAFRDLSVNIPVDVTELMGIGELGGQLGVAKDDLIDFSEVMAQLGVTTNLTSEEASSALAQLSNVMGTSAEYGSEAWSRLGSTIVELGNNLATTEADIVSFASYIGGAGEIAGMTEADVLSIGAAMSSVGVQAEAGGTAIQKVFLGINEAVTTGSESLDVFAETAGLSAEQFAKLWDDDASAAFEAFVEGLGAAGDDAISILTELELTDQRLVRAFLSLANAGDLLGDSLEIGNEAWEQNIALSKEAEIRFGTTRSKLKILKNTFKDLSLSIGDELLPVFTPFLDNLKVFVDRHGPDVIEWTKNLVGGFTNLTDYFSIVASEGKVLNDFLADVPISIRPVVEGAGEIVNAFRDIKIAFDTDGWPAVGDLFGEWFDNAIELVQGKIVELRESFDFSGLVSATKISLHDIAFEFDLTDIEPGTVTGADEWIRETFSNLGERITGFLASQDFSKSFRLTSFWTQENEDLINAELFDGITSAVTSIDWGQLGYDLADWLAKTFAEGAGQTDYSSMEQEIAMGVLTAAVRALASIDQALQDLIGGMLRRAFDIDLGEYMDMPQWLQNLVDNVAPDLELPELDIPSIESGDAGEAVSDAHSVGGRIGDGLAAGIDEKTPEIKSAAVEAALAALAAAKAALGVDSPSKAFMEVGAFSVEGMAIGITAATPSAISAAQNMSAAVMGAAKGFVGHDSSVGLISLGESIPQSLAVGIAGATSGAVTAANAMASAVASSLDGSLDVVVAPSFSVVDGAADDAIAAIQNMAGAVASALGEMPDLDASMTPATVSPMIATSGYGQGGRMAGEIFAREYAGAVRENLVGMRGEIVDIMTPAIEQERARRGRGMEALP